MQDNLYDKVSRKGSIYQKLRHAKRKSNDPDQMETKHRKTNDSSNGSSDKANNKVFVKRAADLILFSKRKFEETSKKEQEHRKNCD